MKPNLNYAQVRLGIDNNLGGNAGLIELKDFYYFLDAIRLLKKTNLVDNEKFDEFENWLSEYQKWLIESPQGKKECIQHNNHGTYYDLQLAAISCYLGNVEFLYETFARAQGRIAEQINSNGEQPNELKRKTSQHYCYFNIQGFVNLATIARNWGVDLYNYKTNDGISLKKAVSWLIESHKKTWKHKQIDRFDQDRVFPIYEAHKILDNSDMVNSASFNTLTKINFFPHDGVQPYSFLTNSDFRNTKYKVSVVIPGYKNSSSVLRLLESLNRQHFASFEVIVVSDGCEEIIDSTKNYIAQYPLSIYNTGYKQGFGVMLARNLGAQKSQGKLLVFIDPDVILPENFIYNIWKNYSDDTLIIPKVHFVDEFDHDKIILEEDRKGFRNPNSPILGFATQCCAISKLSFINLGGFDEALLGQGGSDSDFGLRHASIYNNAKFLNSIICFHIGLSSGKKYRVGEESKWDRTVYNSRKKSDFYKFPENAVVNDGVNYFYLNKWNEFKNLKSNIVDVDFILATVISDNENYGYLNYLKPSAEYYNIPLKTLYADEQAISRKTGSLSEKDRLLNMVLDNVSDNSIVMFVDGYDTVLLAGKDEIINNFNSYNSPLVVSAEINCHPDSSLASEFPESQYDARFLNTGGFIGYAWAIKKMIKKAQQIEVPDDPKLKLSNQYRWIRVYLDKKDKISLDLSSKLFLSASTKKEARQYDKYSEKRIKKLYLNPDFAKEEMSRIFNLMEIKGKRVKAKNSGSMPCVLHWNGPASVFMQTQSKSFSFLRPWE